MPQLKNIDGRSLRSSANWPPIQIELGSAFKFDFLSTEFDFLSMRDLNELRPTRSPLRKYFNYFKIRPNKKETFAKAPYLFSQNLNFGGLTMRLLLAQRVLLTAAAFSIGLGSLSAQQRSLNDLQRKISTDGQAEFYRAYHLQYELGRLKEAENAYKNALKLGVAKATKKSIRENLKRIQEDQIASNFARLMPADSLGYLEISNPGRHLEELIKMMGLTGRTFEPGHKSTQINLDGFKLSSDFQISPALLKEFKKFRGVAVSISSISQRVGKPIGVAIIHPGDSDLLTGLVETGIQLVPNAESIQGYPTFQIENEVWMVKTNRLIFASTSRTEIESCVARLNDPRTTNSLDESNTFQEAKRRHSNSALFAFVDPKVAMKKLEPMLGRDAAIAQLVLDIPHMKYVALSTSSTQNGLCTKLNVAMEKDHNSIAYGLFRTVPLGKAAVSHVPADAAVVAGLGLNPKLALAAEALKDSHVTVLDIGRELFANIEEVGFFVLPELAKQETRIPEFGCVFVCNNVDKSKALWNHLLSLPEKLQLPNGPTSQDVVINGLQAKTYSFSDREIPDFTICKVRGNAMLVGTELAVRSAITASQSRKTFANSKSANMIWTNQPANTPAKVACVNLAQAVKLAGQMENERNRQFFDLLRNTLDQLTVTLVSNEGPADFEFKIDVANLPQFEALVKTAARLDSPRNAFPREYRAMEVERAVRRSPNQKRARSTPASSAGNARTETAIRN